MFDFQPNTSIDYSLPTPHGTEPISNSELKAKTESLNEINRALSKRFRPTSELIEGLAERKIEDYESAIFQLKPLYSLIKRYISEKKVSFPLINFFAESEVIDSISRDNNEFIKFILEETISKIKFYLYSLSKINKIGICLQKDPEDPSFNVYLIVINTQIKNFEERNHLEDKICDLIDNILNDFKDNVGNKKDFSQINEVKKNITFIIDDINAKI